MRSVGRKVRYYGQGRGSGTGRSRGGDFFRVHTRYYGRAEVSRQLRGPLRWPRRWRTTATARSTTATRSAPISSMSLDRHRRNRRLPASTPGTTAGSHLGPLLSRRVCGQRSLQSRGWGAGDLWPVQRKGVYGAVRPPARLSLTLPSTVLGGRVASDGSAPPLTRHTIPGWEGSDVYGGADITELRARTLRGPGRVVQQLRCATP
jgi:hypothetical protein